MLNKNCVALKGLFLIIILISRMNRHPKTGSLIWKDPNFSPPQMKGYKMSVKDLKKNMILKSRGSINSRTKITKHSMVHLLNERKLDTLAATISNC